MAGMTKKRSKTVLISIRVPLEVRTQTNVVKKKINFQKIKERNNSNSDNKKKSIKLLTLTIY